MKKVFALVLLALAITLASGCSFVPFNSTNSAYGGITVVNGTADYILEVKEDNVSYGVLRPGESLVVKTDLYSCPGPYIRQSLFVIAWDTNGFRGASERTFTIKNIYYSYGHTYSHPPCESNTWLVRKWEVR